MLRRLPRQVTVDQLGVVFHNSVLDVSNCLFVRILAICKQEPLQPPWHDANAPGERVVVEELLVLVLDGVAVSVEGYPLVVL